MGKVASLAIHQALSETGAVNAFHSHSLSSDSQEQMLRHLLTGAFTHLLARELRYHVQNAALGMLVRWYQAHGPYQGRRLKLVTLTREPVAHYVSSFIQRKETLLPQIAAWQRTRPGGVQQPDEAQAVRDFVIELVSIIAEAGIAARNPPAELAHARWPGHPVVAQEVNSCLRPLTWLDAEILATTGFDVLAEPELRRRGWVVLQNDWAEVLALRFEQLSSLTPKIAAFAGVPELALPQRNVTDKKAGASAYKAAIQAALDTPVGQAYVRAVRGSAYARACGYDEPAATA
jgi:hypothetical protein